MVETRLRPQSRMLRRLRGRRRPAYNRRSNCNSMEAFVANYLLIESRDPFETAEVQNHYKVAEGLKQAGNEVTLFLVENGVLPARKSPASERLTALSRAGVTVLADAFSLKERGISDGALAEGVSSSPLETVVDRLEAGAKAIWH